jgi:hypothetical protein
MSEVECFGVDYERRDLGKLLERLAKEYQTRNVLEIPVSDEKAMPSIYPLAFRMAGCVID